MNSCPIIHVKKSVSVFQFDLTKPITTVLTPDEANTAIIEIKKNIDQYDRCCQPAIKASETSVDNEKKADKYVAEAISDGKLKIVHSALNKNFVDKYSQDIARYKTATSLMEFLKQFFGKYSTRQREAEAMKQLANATRRSIDNEPFVLFLARLKAIAGPASTKPDIRTHLIENAFRSNLNSTINMFLLDHDKIDSDIETIAVFLDDKQKFMRNATVNMIQNDEISAMKKMIVNLTELVEKSLLKQSADNDSREVNVNQINRSTILPKRNNWDEKRRCQKCGMYNHKTAECSGKCRITCRRCNQIGHLEAVCRMAKNAR